MSSKSDDNSLTLAEEARFLLKKLDAAPQRRFGQNFMVDVNALQRVTKEALSGSPAALLEIGPGLGFLTRELAASGLPLTAVEIDRKYAKYLRSAFEHKPNVTIHEADILEVNPFDIGSTALCCVGNIPYNLSSPLLEWLTLHRLCWSDVVLTTQKDFADRLCAKPGTRECGALTCWMQLHASIETLRVFGKDVFSPRPDVESSLIRVNFFEKPRYEACEAQTLELCIRLGFQQRRKTLMNALFDERLVPDKAALAAGLERAGIAPTSRAENLTLDQWLLLGKRLSPPRWEC